MKKTLFFIAASIFFVSCQNDMEEINDQGNMEQGIDKKELTLILEEDDAANSLKQVTANQLEFEAGTGLEFSKYQYIVSTPTKLAPNGFLRKVTAIEEFSGKVVLTTESANINELLDTAELHEKSYFVPENPEAYKNLVTKDGKKINYTVKRNFEWEYDFTEFSLDLDEMWDADNNPATTYDQVRVNGNLTIQPSLLVDIDIRFFQLREFKSVINATTSADLTLDWRTNIPVNFTQEVANIDLPPTTFQLAWLPVVINHNLTVLLDVNGNVSARVTSSFAGSLDTETGVRYQAREDQWSFINNVENFDMDFVPYDANARFNLNARLSERFESSMFEIGRVGLRSSQNLFANANLSGTYGDPFVLTWNANADVTVGAFAELMFDIPNIPTSWEDDIWSAEFELGRGTIVFE